MGNFGDGPITRVGSDIVDEYGQIHQFREIVPPVNTPSTSVFDNPFGTQTTQHEYGRYPGVNVDNPSYPDQASNVYQSQPALGYMGIPPAAAGRNDFGGPQQLNSVRMSDQFSSRIQTAATAFGSPAASGGYKAKNPKDRARCGCGQFYALNKTRSNTMCRSCTKNTTASMFTADQAASTQQHGRDETNDYGTTSGSGFPSFQQGGFPQMLGSLKENSSSTRLGPQPLQSTQPSTLHSGTGDFLGNDAEMGVIGVGLAAQHSPVDVLSQFGNGTEERGHDVQYPDQTTNTRVLPPSTPDFTQDTVQAKSSRYRFSKERALCACGKDYALNRDRANAMCRTCTKASGTTGASGSQKPSSSTRATGDTKKRTKHATFEAKYEPTFATEADALKRLARDPSVTVYYKLQLPNDNITQLDNIRHHQLSEEVFDAILHEPASAPMHLSEGDVSRYNEKQEKAYQQCKEYLSTETGVIDARACSNRVVYAAKHLHLHGIPEIELKARKKTTKTGYTIDSESTCLGRIQKMIALIKDNKRIALDILKGLFCPLDDFARAPDDYAERKMVNFNVNKNKDGLLNDGRKARQGTVQEVKAESQPGDGAHEDAKAGVELRVDVAEQPELGKEASSSATLDVSQLVAGAGSVGNGERTSTTSSAFQEAKVMEAELSAQPAQRQTSTGADEEVQSAEKDGSMGTPELFSTAGNKRKSGSGAVGRPQKRTKTTTIDEYDTSFTGPEATEPDEGAMKASNAHGVA
ncbi:hypothetical protein LTR85_009762 [Meristemomyces frigidus]|nr:hypothetical protein LTR85_009762 [Meristemomyces frigidus]